jgi:hypothetical protein
MGVSPNMILDLHKLKLSNSSFCMDISITKKNLLRLFGAEIGLR